MISESSKNQAQTTLEQLKRELTGLDTQWEQITREREKLKAGINGLEQFLGSINLNGAHAALLEDSQAVSSIPVINKNTFRSMTVREAAYKFLKMMRRGVTNRELVDALLKGGLKTKSKHPADSIRTILQRDQDTFFWDKEERLWKLVEWSHPAEEPQA